MIYMSNSPLGSECVLCECEIQPTDWRVVLQTRILHAEFHEKCFIEAVENRWVKSKEDVSDKKDFNF